MAHSKVIISVLAIKNHPDINGVLDYLEEHKVIPPYYEEFDFCLPRQDYDEYKTRLVYALNIAHKVNVPYYDNEVSTYAIYQKKNDWEDWIFVLADCEGGESEQAVADYYRRRVLSSNVVPESQIYVVTTEDKDPEFPEDLIEAKMFTGGEMDSLAAKLLASMFGKDNFSITGCNYSFTDSNSAEYEINFSYLGKTFVITFEYENCDFSARLCEIKNGFLITATKYVIEDFRSVKQYILETCFSSRDMKRYVKPDVQFLDPTPEIQDGKLVFAAKSSGNNDVSVIINPVTKDVSVVKAATPSTKTKKEEEEELPESLEAKVNFIYTQVKWLKEQHAVHDEAIKRLQAK